MADRVKSDRTEAGRLCGASGGHALPFAIWVGRGRRTRRERKLQFSRSKLRAWILSALLLLPFVPVAQTRAEPAPEPLLVFAAASLADVLTEVARAFEESESTEVTLNFAASSILARQIGMGAPADVFMSADEAKMDDLERDGLLVTRTRRSLVGNQLVIVVPADSPLQLRDAAGLLDRSISRIALADPRSVPAGIYTRAYLEDSQLWEALVPRLIPTSNVRAALAAVESGNVDAGFVYLTDAMGSTRVAIRYRVPIGEGPKIVYPVAVVSREGLNPMAIRFVAFLSAPEIMQIFRSHGFLLLDPAPPFLSDGSIGEP